MHCTLRSHRGTHNFAQGAGLLAALLVALARWPLAHAADANCPPTGSPTLRWATKNDMLVAPVNLHFGYAEITNPLSARLLDEGLVVEMPKDYAGGFAFQAADNSSDTTPSGSGEEYRLKRLVVRRAQLGSQVIPHTYEVSLLHQLVDGDQWANVLVPIEVVNQGVSTSLLSVVEHTTLPTSVGEEVYVLTHSSQILKVNEAFDSANFLHFWRAMGTQCDSTTHARFLMRTNSMMVEWEIGHLLEPMLQALDKVEPEIVSGDVWTVNTCTAGGTCTNVVAKSPEEAETRQGEVEQLREQAEQEVEERTKLFQDAQAAGNADMVAAAARDLQAATDELAQVKQYVTSVSDRHSRALEAVWDADKDAKTDANSTTNHSQTGNVTQALIALHSKLFLPVASSSDCLAMRQSPVAIQSKKAVDPGQIDPQLREPIGFKADLMGGNGLHTQVQKLAWGARVLPKDSRNSSTSHMPMGAVLAQHLAQGVSYVDVHVPGQHAIDGSVSAAEVHIVHIPPSDHPAVVFAVRLGVAEDDERNPWIASILPGLASSRDAQASWEGVAPLSLLHPALEAGRIERYFHYDGTLTTPPCRETHWYIIEEPGTISQRQLAALRDVFGEQGPPQMFKAGAVVLGSQSILSKVAPASLRGRGGSSGKRKLQALGGETIRLRV
mmetsp:Transcript_30132/g.70277  ORF Transcript_30132/g.70277 Transcript_30132/m.70277 type:complete len:666 (+) Transcript_30132:242-2239(+)